MANYPIKPLSVARADFITEFSALINQSMLPAFILEPILRDMYSDIKIIAQKQLEEERVRYEQALNTTKQSATDVEE